MFRVHGCVFFRGDFPNYAAWHGVIAGEDGVIAGLDWRCDCMVMLSNWTADMRGLQRLDLRVFVTCILFCFFFFSCYAVL